MPKAALYTLGCRLNQAETANIARDLQNRGFEIVPFGEAADLTVVNTCTVTEKADARCRQAVRKSVRKNPDTFVAVIGCYAQMAVEDIRRIEGVDLIMGNEHKMQLADYVETLDKMSEPRVVHTSKISRESFTIESVGFYDTHTRANIKIQDGCNFVCSFCIIATARGPARSRDFQDILQEAHKLAEMGHRELVLSGVNIGTYKNEDKNFLDLVAALEQVPGIERIRISSIEPTTVTRELIDYMAGSAVVCPYLHIPLQSGDDAILDSMRRKHDAAFFREIIEYAAEKIPHIGIGTDIMVGYPGEDEQAFKNSK
ncbi:MAG TPA: MiaB/RimO family radical SAM methylthiotransferase, partial [Caldithrix abyssi]|nr:MiaB/RimO family radical SAM methylthiotransferase [Caldithrix abyssi]